MTTLATLILQALHLEPLPITDSTAYLEGFDGFRDGKEAPESGSQLTGWLDADRIDEWRTEARRSFGSDE